jgi:hypothetical protein
MILDNALLGHWAGILPQAVLLAPSRLVFPLHPITPPPSFPRRPVRASLRVANLPATDEYLEFGMLTYARRRSDSMRSGPCIFLAVVLVSVACRSVHPTGGEQQASNRPVAGKQTRHADDFQGVKTIADIAKLSWVNKRCRLWAADGDIDVDQTCLVSRTVKGEWVVIPNEYVDNEMKEILGQLGNHTKDRWLQRFYDVGGGEKPQK